MFKGHNGLEMRGDHLDINYNEPAAWPPMTPGGTIRTFIFDVGDEESGPNVQLGLIAPTPEEELDWRHSIDPLHHHGSDQFRVLLQGEWVVAGRKMAAGDFLFQDSGMIYQEHPGPSGAWIMLVMGDRRGNQATIARKKDEETLFEYGDVYGKQTEGGAYPHPAGDRGIAAIGTTIGGSERGFVRGNWEGPHSGLFGEPKVGPLVYTLKAAPNEVIMPDCHLDTEMIVTVIEGNCLIDGKNYAAGEMRVQRGGTSLKKVLAGPSGAKLVVLLADRSNPPVFSASATAPAWLDGARMALSHLAAQTEHSATS